jgi:hypothetical protein
MRHSGPVSGRASKLVLAAGFVVVFALAIGLMRLTRSATQAAPLQGHGPAATSRAPVVSEPAAPHAPAIAAREQRSAPTTPRAQVTMPVRQPELAPPQTTGRVLKLDANGKLVPMVPVQDLKDQFAIVDAPMKACLERSGKRPTGQAMLNFTVSAKNNRVIVDATGVQDEETLAAYPELLECMHQTAKVLVLDRYPVPELGTPILVRRRVRVEDGVLAENTIFNFSYTP